MPQVKRSTRGLVILADRGFSDLPKWLRKSLIRRYPLPAEHDAKRAKPNE